MRKYAPLALVWVLIALGLSIQPVRTAAVRKTRVTAENAKTPPAAMPDEFAATGTGVAPPHAANNNRERRALAREAAIMAARRELANTVGLYPITPEKSIGDLMATSKTVKEVVVKWMADWNIESEKYRGDRCEVVIVLPCKDILRRLAAMAHAEGVPQGVETEEPATTPAGEEDQPLVIRLTAPAALVGDTDYACDGTTLTVEGTVENQPGVKVWYVGKKREEIPLRAGGAGQEAKRLFTYVITNIPDGLSTIRFEATDNQGRTAAATARVRRLPGKPRPGEERINPIDGAVMIWVPGGTFTMGTPGAEEWNDEYPAHRVTLSGYWMYKYEVTVAQYRKFCAATNHKMPSYPLGPYTASFSWAEKSGWGDPVLQQHPIVGVSWYDAKAYADWAAVQLPTEAQWEYAARGTQGRNYPWGGLATPDEPNKGWNNTKCANRDNSYYQWISTRPVGSFPGDTSWCGIKDMAGSVTEWCADWFGRYPATDLTDPTGPAKSDCRVQRGGSWDLSEGFCRTAKRNGVFPDCGESMELGIRCAASTAGR